MNREEIVHRAIWSTKDQIFITASTQRKDVGDEEFAGITPAHGRDQILSS